MPVTLSCFPVLRGLAEISFEDGYLYARGSSTHGGIDILSDPGTVIVSPVSGRVVARCRLGGTRLPGVGNSGHGGNYAVIVDSSRNFHYFSHMRDTPAVQPGQSVSPGSSIGVIGATGNAQGVPHLHYQVWGPFTHEGCEAEYESLAFVYAFTGSQNPYGELARLAAAMGARSNPGGRYFIPPIETHRRPGPHERMA